MPERTVGMESCLMSYYVLNTELKNSCDFNPVLFEDAPSVYEVIRIEKGVPLFLHDHIKRFFRSGKLNHVDIPVTEKQIISRVKAVVEANRMITGLIKFLFLDHPVAGPLFAAWVTPFFFPLEELYNKGIEMISLPGERVNPNAKVSHQTVRQKADELIDKSGVYEVMLVNSNGVITEGSRSNLFFVKGGILFSAHSSLILPGVTRDKIMELALDSGIDIFESEFKTAELSCMEAAFITGTTPKVMPVQKIDTYSFGIDHPVVKHLMKQYDKLVSDYIDKFRW